MSDEITCAMCKGKGKLVPSGGYALVFQDDVDKFTPAELAVVMMSSACVAEAKKLGIDPTKIKVRLDFGETKRHMCFKLEKEKR